MTAPGSPATAIPPVERSIAVSWNQGDAFRRFALEFGDWWPWRTHSIGGTRVKRVVLEPRVDGRIFEEHVGGRRFQWGRILEWDPPRRLKFTFHPARQPETAQEVEVRFVPEGNGTRVELISTKWETLGRQGRRARHGYNLGWALVLKVWAGRGATGMIITRGLTAVVEFGQLFLGGRSAAINRAGGEIPNT